MYANDFFYKTNNKNNLKDRMITCKSNKNKVKEKF